jgi:hypothetical protein
MSRAWWTWFRWSCFNFPEFMHCPVCGRLKVTPWTAREHMRHHHQQVRGTRTSAEQNMANLEAFGRKQSA